MTSPEPAGAPPPPAESIPLPPLPAPPAPAPPRRRYVLLIAVVGLAAAAGLGAWWWWPRRAEAPPEPPLPAGIEDEEVRLAVEQARQKVRDNPRDADAWGRLGLVFLGNLFDRAADASFAEAARLDPRDPRWPFGRAVIALKRAPDRAVPLLRQALAVADAWPEYRTAIRMELADALLDRDELEEAEKLYREEGPRHSPRGAFGLGLLALRRGEDAEARELLTTAHASPFARKRSAAQLAALARRRGDKAEAERYEQEAAALSDDPPWPDPIRDQAIELRVGLRGLERRVALLERERRFADAANLWLARLRARPSTQARVGAGVNLARLGDYDRALPLLREAVRLDPDSAQAHYALGLALFSRAERQELEDNSPEVREEFREAARHGEEAARLKPDHGMAYLYWGLSLKHLGRPAEAVAPLQKGVACHPEIFELQLALGQVLLQLGRKDDAKKYLENARRIDPKDPRVAEALERLSAPEKK